jgi:ElaB/YqjD/DUF883 family membrane-anchored ribosome-binding protein
MSERTTDVQRDIAQTRQRMSETIAELDARISGRVAMVTERLDLKQLIEDHPWPALAVALGLGVLLAGTGADAKAARATVRAAKGAPGTTADLARRGWDAAASAVRGDGDGEPDVDVEEGLADRLRSTITRAIGVDELMSQMRDAAAGLARPVPYVGQNVPRNTGQQI